ncbi:MAG: protein translocase subunit SecD [Endozoicomonadaceae bacterium]|nr:protein translocase subunit SecD [Endozoicomonadaceae bacterium]MBE8232145.1 protein translocase subunit SecD [Endozoicomonadaceae bacterium]
MLNRYPVWKYCLILTLIALSIIYALPTLYPDDPAIQISSTQAGEKLSETFFNDIQKKLKDHQIEIKALDVSNQTGLFRFHNSQDQLQAKTLLKETLDSDDYIVALNLAATTPAWLKAIGATPMKLGLDLSGGVHFLLAVDLDKAVKTRLEVVNAEIRSLLRLNRLRYRLVHHPETQSVELFFQESSIQDEAYQLLNTKFQDLKLNKITENSGKFGISYTLLPDSIRAIKQYAIQKNLTTIRNRVNELGVSEPLVQRQGENHIVVELPGVQDTAEAKRILGKTANLEFRLAIPAGSTGDAYKTFRFRNKATQMANLSNDIIITGNQVTDAKFTFNQQSAQPIVNITLSPDGGNKMLRVTQDNLGQQMAVVYLEQKPIIKPIDHQNAALPSSTMTFKEEASIISLATIQGVFGNQFQISGLNSPVEASELALLLRSGALAAPMYFVEESTIGPSLGKENIQMGIESTLIGLILVLIFMVLCYRKFGWIANVALLFNLIILVALMSIMGATLTMPGIAGIVLTLGMAVDANVLINSRIREEYHRGITPQKAIFEGYNRAFISVFDANITTLIAGIILYAVGTGSVKGFAVTLSLGIITSMFTAVTVSRALVNLTYGRNRRLKVLKI